MYVKEDDNFTFKGLFESYIFYGLYVRKSPYYLSYIQKKLVFASSLKADLRCMESSCIPWKNNPYLFSSVGFTYLQPFCDSCYSSPEIHSWISFYFALSLTIYTACCWLFFQTLKKVVSSYGQKNLAECCKEYPKALPQIYVHRYVCIIYLSACPHFKARQTWPHW